MKKERKKPERNWERLYNTYQKRYMIVSEKSDFEFEPMYSFYDFKTVYLSSEQDKLKAVEQGKRKVLNVTQDIVAKQAISEYSFKQARVLKKALSEAYGDKITIKEIRSGRYSKADKFWDMISDFYYNKITSENIKDYPNEFKNILENALNKDLTVGQVFFGSP